MLKAQSTGEKKGAGLRNILVIIQFGASIFLITGTLAVNRQLGYIRNTDVGFDKNNLLVLRTAGFFRRIFQQTPRG